MTTPRLTRVFLLCTAMLTSYNATAQTTPTPNWAMSIPGTGVLTVSDMLCNRDGYPVVAGSFSDEFRPYEGVSINAIADGNMYFLTYSSFQTLEQMSIMYSDGYGEVKAMAMDTAGHMYACGYFQSVASMDLIDLVSSGSKDIFVLKMSPTGKAVWLKKFGGTLGDQALDIAIAPNGNDIYVCGSFLSSTMTIGSSTLTNAGTTEKFFVARFDSTLTPITAVTSFAATGSSALAVGIEVGTDNLVRTAINFDGTLQATATAPSYIAGSYDVMVARWDSLLTDIDHSILLYGIGESKAVSIDMDANNNTYVTGDFKLLITTNTFGVISNGMTDAFLAKFDSMLTSEWIVGGGGTLDDVAGDVHVIDNNQILFGGTFQGLANFEIDTLDNVVGLDGFVLNVDADGALNYSMQPGNEADEWLNALATDADGTIYMAGLFNGPTTLANNNLTVLQSEADAWLMVAGLPANSVKEVVQKTAIGPNPTSGSIYLRGVNQVLKIQVLDLTGRVLQTTLPSGNPFTLNLSSYQAGTYLLRVFDHSGRVETHRVVRD